MKPCFYRLTLFAGLVTTASCTKSPTPPPKAEKSEAARVAEREEMPSAVKLTAAAIAEAAITTWKVQPVDLAHLLVLTGSVGHNENQLAQIAANVRGRVSAIPVDLGARVSMGAALVEIESVDLGRAREEFLIGLAAFRVAVRSFERAQALVQAKAISPSEFQAREGEYFSRKAAVQAAQRALRLYGENESEIDRLREAVETNGALPAADAPRLVIRAPFDGRVIERKVTPGSLVEALQPLMTVANLSSVWVFLQAYEKDLPLLKEGLSVAIRVEAYPQDSFHGRIDFLGSVVETATRTVKVRATVENRAEKLRPGMFAKARVDIPRQQSEAHPVLAVPEAALQTSEGRTVVFVETEPGVFVRRLVEPGHAFEGFTEILGGLKAGEVIVTDGSFVLKSEFAKASLVEEN